MKTGLRKQIFGTAVWLPTSMREKIVQNNILFALTEAKAKKWTGFVNKLSFTFAVCSNEKSMLP